MNERIKELAGQAGLKINYWKTNPPTPMQILAEYEQVEKFAELIVRECMDVVEDAVNHREPASTYVSKIREHFGIE